MPLRKIIPVVAVALLASCAPRQGKIAQNAKSIPPVAGASPKPLAATRATASASQPATQPGLPASQPSTQPASPEVAALIATLNQDDATSLQKAAALQSLELMGHDAEPAITAVAVLLDGDDLLRLHACRTLTAIGPSAISALQKAAAYDKSADVRKAALDAWAQIDVDLRTPIAALKQRLKEAGLSVEGRETAIVVEHISRRDEALFAMGPALRTPAAEHLDTALHGKPADQLQALRAIAEWGPDGAKLAPLIRPLMESPTRDVAGQTADALRALGTEAGPSLVDALSSPDHRAQLLAAGALDDPSLAWISSDHHLEIIAALEKAMNAREPGVCTMATHALCNYGLAAHPALVRAIKAGNAAVKDEVIDELMVRPEGFTENFMQSQRMEPTPAAEKMEATEIELGKLVAHDLFLRTQAKSSHMQSVAMTALRSFPPAAVSDEIITAVDQWLNDGLGDYDVDAGAKIMASMGSAGIPKLIELCSSNSAFSRRAAALALASMPESVPGNPGSKPEYGPKLQEFMLAAMDDPSDQIRKAAFRWLLKAPNPTGDVIRRICALLKQWEVAVAKAGKTAIVDMDERDRVAAVELLGRGGIEPQASVEVLGKTLGDSSPFVRKASVVALRAFREEAKPTFAQLMAIVNDENPADAQEAAKTLLACGREGRRAVAGYYIRRLNADRLTLPETLRAIAEIGPDAEPAVPLLRPWLADRDNELRIAVADTLGQIGPGAGPAIAELTRMEDNSDFDVRQAASVALAKISPEGKGLGPALLAAVNNADHSAAERLAAALRHDDDSKNIAARLHDLSTDDPDEKIRAAARQALKVLAEN